MNETVKEWAEYWLEEYDSKRSNPTTVQAHGYLIRNHIIPNIGETKLTMLTEQDVLCFLDELSLGSAGKRNVSAVLRRIMQQAEADGLIRRNPVTTGLYSCPDRVTANILNEQEIEDYLIEAEKQGRLPMFHLLMNTGVKVGELIQIQWRDVDEQEGILTITGQRSRRIPLDSDTVALLRQEHTPHRSLPRLFLHRGSLKPYTRGEIYCYHRKIITACGLDGIRLCDLRHTCAVRNLRDGADPSALAAMLGHGDAQDLLRLYKPYLPLRKNRRERVTN